MPEVGVVGKLPLEIATRSDLLRTHRELNNIIDQLDQDGLVADRLAATEIKFSDSLVKLVQLNNIDVNDAEQRLGLLGAIGQLVESAPVVQVSFAAEPPNSMLRSIVTWFREEASVHTLLQVGVQPSIVAGCVVRTPNKVFDLTLSHQLKASRDKLKEKIKAL